METREIKLKNNTPIKNKTNEIFTVCYVDQITFFHVCEKMSIIFKLEFYQCIQYTLQKY